MIRTFQTSDAPRLVALWNEAVASRGFYKPWTAAGFTELTNNPHFAPEGLLVAEADGKICGFALGMAREAADFGSIICVCVAKERQRTGIGLALIAGLEAYFKALGKRSVKNYFGAPVNLPWLIPERAPFDHPGAPAVAFNSPLYFLELAAGYAPAGQLDGYFLQLSGYCLPEKITAIARAAAKDGFTVAVYDAERHAGLADFFTDLANPGWQAAAEHNLAQKEPAPMLVIVGPDRRVYGWTGPLYNEASGRGYFAGIGVSAKVRGKGLGTLLFAELCYRSQQNGAKFMSLFTGSDNYARKIYRAAGFRIVQSFAIMTKEL